MTTYDFMIAAKNAVIERNFECGINYSIEDISIVWQSYILGNHKAILIDHGENNRLYEVTYNRDKDEMYLDEYEKTKNIAFGNKEINKFKSVIVHKSHE